MMKTLYTRIQDGKSSFLYVKGGIDKLSQKLGSEKDVCLEGKVVTEVYIDENTPR